MGCASFSGAVHIKIKNKGQRANNMLHNDQSRTRKPFGCQVVFSFQWTQRIHFSPESVPPPPSLLPLLSLSPLLKANKLEWLIQHPPWLMCTCQLCLTCFLFVRYASITFNGFSKHDTLVVEHVDGVKSIYLKIETSDNPFDKRLFDISVRIKSGHWLPAVGPIEWIRAFDIKSIGKCAWTFSKCKLGKLIEMDITHELPRDVSVVHLICGLLWSPLADVWAKGTILRWTWEFACKWQTHHQCLI